MPSVSQKQHNLMAMVANNPAKAKELGIPQSVGKDFTTADKGMKFSKAPTKSRADLQKINSSKTLHGKTELFKKGGQIMAKSDMKEDMKADKKQDVSLIKKAFKQHDAQEHKGGKGTALKLAKGGTFRASANGVASKGKTKGTQIVMAGNKGMCGGGMTKGKK
jgi:hypothetical protein